MTRSPSYPSPDPGRPTSLWPRDLFSGDHRIPVTILAQQAEQLGALAQDALSVAVRSTADATTGLCSHRLNVAISGVENYVYELVRLTHPIQAVFPVGVRCETTGLVLLHSAEGAPATAAKLEEFLRELFAQPVLRNAVRSLYSQGQALKGDKKGKPRRASEDAQTAA